MSEFAHLMCERCWSKTDENPDGVELTDAHAGRRCCYCGKAVEFSLISHRHPDAVRCKGIHERV